MAGVSHGGGINSHGTDAESYPSEQDTDQLGQSMAIHGVDDGMRKKTIGSTRIKMIICLELSTFASEGSTPQPMLTLVETETIFLLSIDSIIVANSSPDLESIKQKNERFVEVISVEVSN